MLTCLFPVPQAATQCEARLVELEALLCAQSGEQHATAGVLERVEGLAALAGAKLRDSHVDAARLQQTTQGALTTHQELLISRMSVCLQLYRRCVLQARRGCAVRKAWSLLRTSVTMQLSVSNYAVI